jgi:hypothetical protein
MVSTSAPSPSPRPRRARDRISRILAIPAVVALGGVGALAAHVAMERPDPPTIVVAAANGASPSSPTAGHVSNTSGVDIQALWRVMLELDPHQSAVVVPALTRDVRAALAAIAHGIAYEGLVDGVEGA